MTTSAKKAHVEQERAANEGQRPMIFQGSAFANGMEKAAARDAERQRLIAEGYPQATD